jgi:hypothetical protein
VSYTGYAMIIDIPTADLVAELTRRNETGDRPAGWGDVRELTSQLAEWKLRAEIAQGALKPVEAERDRQEQLMEDALEFTKDISASHVVPQEVRLKAREFLDRRAKLYDKEHT